MDWNTICLWTVAGVCGLNLWTAVRARPPLQGWAVISAVVLAVTGGLFAGRHRDVAGLAGGSLMAVVIVAPGLLQRLVAHWALRQRFDLARWPATLAGVLHPFDGLRQQARLMRAMDLAGRGDLDAAERLLDTLRDAPFRLAAAAELHRCRLRHRWGEWVDWAEAHVGWPRLRRDPGLLSGYVRGLGELGRLTDMIEATAGQRLPAHPALAPYRAMCRLTAFAFAGQPDRAAATLAGPLASLPPAVAAYWLGTAEQAAGRPAAAAVQFDDAADPAPGMAAVIAHRRAHPPAVADLSPVDRLMLDQLARDGEHEHRYALSANGRRPWATYALVLANLAVFAVELWRAGPAVDTPAYDAALDRLGGLTRAALADHQYWRLLAANFLHYGTAHVVMNMAPLLVLGPMVERSLGRPLYVLLYLLSGMAAVATAAAVQPDPNELLVGASGSIMALVGATAAVLARGWYRDRAAAAARRLRATLLVIIAQAAFDYFTPQVSGLAHLAGVGYGFLLASLIPHRSARPTVRDGLTTPAAGAG